MEDLKDQLMRFRFYGPRSFDIVRNCLQLVDVPDGNKFRYFLISQYYFNFRPNHDEWCRLRDVDTSCIRDGCVFSLLVEDPRLSYPTKRTVLFYVLDNLMIFQGTRSQVF